MLLVIEYFWRYFCQGRIHFLCFCLELISNLIFSYTSIYVYTYIYIYNPNSIPGLYSKEINVSFGLGLVCGTEQKESGCRIRALSKSLSFVEIQILHLQNILQCSGERNG